jgi:hypothetical protein
LAFGLDAVSAGPYCSTPVIVFWALLSTTIEVLANTGLKRFMSRILPMPPPSHFSIDGRPTWRDHNRRRWLWFALLVAIVVWGWVDVRRRARIDPERPPVHKTDFTVYTEAAAAFFDGRDPYEVTNPRGWHYLYPPLFALMLAPLAKLDSQNQALVWYFVSVAACFGMWYECRRLWRHLAPAVIRLGAAPSAQTCPEWDGGRSLQCANPEDVHPPGWLGWLACASIALPTLNCLQRGQVGAVLVYLLLLGSRLVLVSRNVRSVFLGGLVLALPVTIKLTPLLPVGFLAIAVAAAAWWTRKNYSTALACGVGRSPVNLAAATIAGQGIGLALFVFVVPAVLIGHQENVRHLRTWVDRVAANDTVGLDNDFNARSKRNQSLSNGVRRLGNRLAYAAGVGPDDQLVDDLTNQAVPMPMEARAVDGALKVALAASVALLLAAGWRVSRRDDKLGLVALFGMACQATLVVSPLSWGHHYVMWLPGLVFVPYWLWHNDRRALAMGMAESALVLVVAHYVVLDHAGRVGLLGIGSAVWYTVATAAVGWLEKRPGQVDQVTDNLDQPASTALPRRAA